jgi:hypothetical protein
MQVPVGRRNKDVMTVALKKIVEELPSVIWLLVEMCYSRRELL